MRNSEEGIIMIEEDCDGSDDDDSSFEDVN